MKKRDCLIAVPRDNIGNYVCVTIYFFITPLYFSNAKIMLRICYFLLFQDIHELFSCYRLLLKEVGCKLMKLSLIPAYDLISLPVGFLHNGEHLLIYL